MPAPHAPFRFLTSALLLAGPLLAASFPAARAAEPTVVAVLACDGYADIKQQLGWVGGHVNYPQLPAMAESLVMMATQFQGLAGLDPTRPAGIVVSTDGDEPVVHGYVPVKDLDRLLAALQGVIGPVRQVGGKRLVGMPDGRPLEIQERDGWAIISPQGSPAGPANPQPLIDQVAENFSIGVKLFPSAMPEGMREQLRAAVKQASEAAAAQGQPVDEAGMDAALAGIAETESVLFGLAVDVAKERIFLETRSVMVPGSAAATIWSDAGKTGNALSLPNAAGGGPATIRAHHAQAVPPAARAAIEATLAQALPADGDDPITAAFFGLFQDLVAGMLDAGGLEMGLAVDTSAAKPNALLPAVTAAARIKDGPALEKRVKKRFADERALPPRTKIAFDAGKAAGANLHVVEIDIADQPAAAQFGDTLKVTLAVTADRAYLLMGGDVRERLQAAVDAGKRADPEAKPITAVAMSVPGMMAFASEVATASGDSAAGDVLGEVAKESAAKSDALVQLLLRPIERGVAMRLSAGVGAIETIAAAVTRQMEGAAGPAPRGLPLPLDPGIPSLAP